MDNDLSRVVDALPGLVWAAGPDGNIDFLNQRWCEYTGLPVAEALDCGWQTAIHPDDLPGMLDRWLGIIASGKPGQLQTRLRREDGEYRFFHVRTSPLSDASGKIVRWCGINTDVEDLSRAMEDAEGARASRVHANVDSIPALVAFMTPTGELESVNRQVLEYFGTTLDVLKSWTANETVHPEDLSAVITAWTRSIQTKEPYDIEHRMRRADGVYRWFHVRGLPLEDEAGNVVRWYVLQTDIEARRQAEALLMGERKFLEMVASGRSMPEVLSALCLLAEAAANGTYCSVVLVDRTGTHLESGAAPSLPSSFIDSIIGRPVNADSGPCAQAAYLNEQVIAVDLDREMRWQAYSWCPMAIAHGLRACWSTPILSSTGAVLGAFANYFIEPRAPTAEQQALIAQFTHIASIAIEREQAKATLTAALDKVTNSELRLRTIIDAIPNSIWSAGANGRAEFWNKRWKDYAGFSPEQVGDDWTQIVHPDDIEKLTVEVGISLASGKASQVESRMRRFDGEYRWFQSQWEPLRDQGGAILSWYGANTDIDDRKRAEELLAGEKQLLEMIASDMPLQEILDSLCDLGNRAAHGCHCGILFPDPTGKTWQRAAGPTLPEGYNRAMTGRCVNPNYGPCSRAACSQEEVFVTDLMSDDRWEAGDWRTLALGFGLRSCWSSPILARDKTTLGVLAFYQMEPGQPTALQLDVVRQLTQIASIAVERSSIDSALKRSEACLAEAQRLSLTGSFGWRVSIDAHFWSEETFRIFEYEPATRVSIQLVLDRAHPDDIHFVQEAIELAAHGMNIDYECRFLMPSGLTKFLHIVAHESCSSDGQVEYIGAVQDVTERRSSEADLGQLRAEMTHMARVTSLGALTASIAHEVNQPLSGIITNASTCLRMLAGNPPNVDGAIETAKRTIRDGHRASDVIARLRALFGKNSSAKESFDLNEAAQEVIALSLTDLRRAKIILRPDFAEGLPHVAGDRIQLQQVILNLLMNAVDAMREVDDRPRRLIITTKREEGAGVQLMVKDVGVGLASQDVERLFDAFYTTKESGMGIGLAVCRSIIESHRGRLSAVTNDGPGATFSFWIPFGDHGAAIDSATADGSRGFIGRAAA